MSGLVAAARAMTFFSGGIGCDEVGGVVAERKSPAGCRFVLEWD